MERRSLAKILGVVAVALPGARLAAQPVPPPAAPKPPAGPQFAVWVGSASVVPKDTDYTLTGDPGPLLAPHAAKPEDKPEIAVLMTRMAKMPVGATDSVRIGQGAEQDVVRVIRIK